MTRGNVPARHGGEKPRAEVHLSNPRHDRGQHLGDPRLAGPLRRAQQRDLLDGLHGARGGEDWLGGLHPERALELEPDGRRQPLDADRPRTAQHLRERRDHRMPRPR